MKTYFISWEIRPSASEIAYSNTVSECGDDVTPKVAYDTAINEIAKHYDVAVEKVTARTFNVI